MNPVVNIFAASTAAAVDEICRQTAALTFVEAMTTFAPVYASLDALNGEVKTHRGYPAFVDFHGDLCRIDLAMKSWASCWKRMAKDIDVQPLIKLAYKLENGMPLEEPDLKKARDTVDRQMARFLTLPRTIIKSHTTTELIAIELESLGLKEAA